MTSALEHLFFFLGGGVAEGRVYGMIQTHLGEGEVAFGLEQIGSELYFPWQQISPIDLQWENL